MEPRKNDGSHWGHDEQGNGQLKGAQFFHNLPPTSQQPQNATLEWNFHTTPQKHSVAKILKNGSVKTQGESSQSTKLAKCSETHKRKLQQERQRLMPSGRQDFFLVTRTPSDHNTSLWPQGTKILLLWTILLWWRPAISHRSVFLTSLPSLLLRFFEHQISNLCQAWT